MESHKTFDIISERINYSCDRKNNIDETLFTRKFLEIISEHIHDEISHIEFNTTQQTLKC